MIKPFPFELPADCHGEVVGFLYEADDPADLGQDMIEVQLSSGVTIDAGWYPEGAADGAYVVKARHPRGIECSVESYASVADAAAAITRWISGDPQALPACSTPARPEL